MNTTIDNIGTVMDAMYYICTKIIETKGNTPLISRWCSEVLQSEERKIKRHRLKRRYKDTDCSGDTEVQTAVETRDTESEIYRNTEAEMQTGGSIQPGEGI